MSEQELRVLNMLGEAFNEFQKLPVLHYSDLPEFVHAIHAAQNIILARAGLREAGVIRPELPKQHIVVNGMSSKEFKAKLDQYMQEFFDTLDYKVVDNA